MGKVLRCNLGSVLTKHRKSKGFKSGKEYARNIGVSDCTYTRIEAGYDCKISTFLEICKKANIDPKEIINKIVI